MNLPHNSSPNSLTNQVHSVVPVIDLTDSPTSSHSSEAADSVSPCLSVSPSCNPSRAKRPQQPPSFARSSPASASKSSPLISTPILNSTPADQAPHRADTPRRRATFILSGDCDPDGRDPEGEVGSVIDDSDSDRTSFFSAEEYVSSAGRGALSSDDYSEEGWRLPQPLPELEPGFRGEADLQQDGERDAAHNLRRWHVLMEVVHTEVGYVRDLRVLVHVYLASLPSLPLSAPAQEAIQVLARDGAELLSLHERFMHALERASEPAVSGVSPGENVDVAVKQVADLFINEAPTFDLYQQFCATQPEALRLLRSAQARTEWAAFERRCAAGGDLDTQSQTPSSEPQGRRRGSSLTLSGSPSSNAAASTSALILPSESGSKSPPPRALSLMPSAFKVPLQTSGARNDHRRHSYDSLAGVFGGSTNSNIRPRPPIDRPASDPVTNSTRTSSAVSSQTTKLRFQDFLIKPIQRICKYPLMLEGLRSKRRGENADVAVSSAVDSMRAVVLRVNEARKRKEVATKTRLIVDRIEPHTVVTSDFLTSLGDCLLAGSLDVVHHHHLQDPITSPVRVKYLGVFLYSGGYLLIVKVGKGKTYRIKHWFSLASFELVDIPESDALIPSAFRLSSMHHHFEMVASCQREKDLWLRAMNEACRAPRAWHVEPASSLQILNTEQQAPIPAGQSPDTMEAPVVIKRGGSSGSINDLTHSLALRFSSTRFRSSPTTPTVRYIFSKSDEPSPIPLRRSTGANRVLVERGLADVVTDLVSSVRKHAQAQQQPLFPSRLADTSQTVANAAKSKLAKRGSILVSRPRSVSVQELTEEDAKVGQSTVRQKCSTSWKRKTLLPALSVLYTEPQSIEDRSAAFPASGYQSSQDSSDKSSLPSPSPFVPGSPTLSSHTKAQPAALDEHNDNQHFHRRARSLVGSVKGLMRRSTRSSPAQPDSETWQVVSPPETSSSENGESTETGSKSSIGRRRVSSAPTSPVLPSNPLSIFSDSIRQSPVVSDSSGTSTPPHTIDHPTLPPTASETKLSHEQSVSNRTLKARRSVKNFMFYNALQR